MASFSSLKSKIELHRANRKSEVRYVQRSRIHAWIIFFGLIFFIVPQTVVLILSISSFIQIIPSFIQILQNLGGVMIATGVFLVVEDHYYKHRYDGINRPPPHLYLPHVISKLYLMGITLHDFHSDTAFITGLMDKSTVPNRCVDYKFLLLFPLSQELSDREDEENLDPRSLIKECHTTLCHLLYVKDQVCKNNPNNKCEIRFYNLPPRRSVIITDDPIFIGPYFYGKRGFESKWMEISNKGMYYQYSKEFDDIWEKSLEYEYKKHKKTSQIEDGYKDLKFEDSDSKLEV